MAVEAELDNNLMYPESVSISVDTTPRDGGDTEGAISTANFSVPKGSRNHALDKRKEVVLRDGFTGDDRGWVGQVRTIQDNFSNVSYVAVDKLNDLNIFVNLPPYKGTLGGALEYYIGQNIKSSAVHIEFDTDKTSIPVVFPAINGNLWEHIKMLLAAYELDLTSTARGNQLGNLFPDPDFEMDYSFAGWEPVNKGLEKWGTGSQQGSYPIEYRIPAQPGETFHVSALGELVEGTLSNDNLALSIYARYYPGAGNGTTLSRVLFWQASNINTNQSQFFTLPEGENIENVRLGFFTESPVPTDARVRISQVQLTRPKTIRISDIGKHPIDLKHYESGTLDIGLDEPAKDISANFYTYTWVENGLLYPEHGWEEDTPVQTLVVGTNEFDIELESSIFSLTTPEIVDFVPVEYNGTRTVYAVVGEDDRPILAAQWNAMGGKLETKIGDDHKTIHVTVFVPPGFRNPDGSEMKTVRLAMSSGSGNDYSSLRIVGTGAHVVSSVKTLPTGIDEKLTGVASGPVFDNPFIDSPDKAWRLLVEASPRYSSGILSMPVSVPNQFISRDGQLLDPSEMPGGIWQDPESKRWFRVRGVQTDLGTASLGLEDFLNIEHYEEAWGSTGEVLLENLARTPQAIYSSGFSSNLPSRNPISFDQALPVPHPNPRITRGAYSTLTDPAFTEVLSIYGIDTPSLNAIDVDRYVGFWLLIENQNHQAGDWWINVTGGPNIDLPAGNNTWFWVTLDSPIPANNRGGMRVACRRGDFDHTTAKVWITGIVSLADRVPTPEDFFDGDTAWGDRASYEWTGTPNRSSSVKRDHTSWKDIYLKYQGLTHEQIRIEGIKNW